MSRPTVRIHDLATNEVIDREMNDQEFTAFEADQAAQIAAQAVAEAKAAAKAALLERLEITAEEAQLLLGGN